MKSFSLPLLRSRRGSALLIVLAMLVLIALIVVGFFAHTVVLRKSTANEKAVVSTQYLGDAAVNLVQAQIDHATTRGADKAWASQPGAIRIFKQSGDLERIYKLYSSSALTTDDTNDLADDVPLANWASMPALWVDLNRPVTFSDPSGSDVTRFPILDPRDPSNLSQVASTEGFALNNPPGATAAQPAPMPVRWLYYLQNGQVVAPAENSAGPVTVSGASVQNPIVGRIAFWADDETCKVNVNTAGGASEVVGAHAAFWDTPRFNAPDERAFGIYQPAAGEYQRYPGHPATTTLGKLFPTLGSSELIGLSPRYRFGGSQDATQIAGAQVGAKKERLYSSLGEMLYDKDRNPGVLSAQQLESAKFLATAHSRSPELNLFGKPRVSVWPAHAEDAKRTPVDRLLAFSSTVNEQPYYFTRSDPTNPSTDISLSRNNALLDYLDDLTKDTIPGFGGNFDAKYPDDRRDILVKIFDYVRSTNLNDSLLPQADRYAAGGRTAPAKRTGWNAQGFGRFPVITEASLWFVALGRGATTSPVSAAVPVHANQVGTKQGAGDTALWASALVPANNRTAVQAYFLLSFFDPSQGWSAITEHPPTVKVEGLNGLSIMVGSNTFPLEMSGDATVGLTARIGGIQAGRAWGGANGFRVLILLHKPEAPHFTSRNRPLGANAAPDGNNYPLYSSILSLPVGGAMRLNAAGLVRVKIYSGATPNTAAANLVTTYDFDLSQLGGMDMPVPTLAGGVSNSFGLPIASATDRITARDRSQISFAASVGTPGHLADTVAATDVLWSLVPSAAAIAGDYRLLSRDNVPSSAFVRHPAVASGVHLAYTTMFGSGSLMSGATPGGNLIAGTAYYASAPGTFVAGGAASAPAIPSGIDGVSAGVGGTAPGDWDNGFSIVMDGPYINKADEGNIQGLSTTKSPYFDENYWTVSSITDALFSPNRMIPSPGILGSLSTGTLSGQPWQTLLFRPGPSGHKGASSPRDHLFLDLFWMPVAEPYAISEPFSTDGKVNLNYQIQPFTYIKRNTALRSVLASEEVAKVPKSAASTYKRLGTGAGLSSNARHPLNLSETNGTLRQFEEKFANGDVFKSASEICDVFLVPQGSNWSGDSAALAAWYGDDFALVGDNTRERPYTDLYGRLTTKSNTYTVHFVVQALKNTSADPAVWNEEKGAVTGELRGSTTLERYIDPNDTSIPDYATDLAASSLENHYNWRVIENRRFAP